MLIAALGGAVFLLLPQDATTLLLSGYLFTAPIAISKALAKGAGVYAPALEITLSDLFLAGLFGVWVIRHAMVKTPPRGRSQIQLGAAVIAFFGWAWVSAFNAQVLSHGMLAALNLSKYLLVFILISALVDSLPRLRVALTAIGAGMALQLVIGVLQVLTRSRLILPGMKTSGEERLGYLLSYGGNGELNAWRPAGLIQHPNFFADYLVMVLPPLLVLTLLGAKRIGWFAHRVAVVLLTGGSLVLALTLSRGGWIAGFVAAVATIGLLWRRNLISPRVVRRTALLAAAGAGLLLVAYPPVLLRIVGSDERSAESRLLMMKQALGIVREHPMLGVGLASYSRVARASVPPDFARFGSGFREALVSGVVHNGYLVFWAERGVVGLLLTLALYTVFIRAALHVRHWREPLLAVVGLGLTASLVGQLVLYNFDHFYLDSRPGVLWIVFGLLAAVLRLNDRLVSRDFVLPAAWPGRLVIAGGYPAR